jgi:hydroxylamine reductase
MGVEVMALLDKANTESYGNPEITEVNIGTRNNPAILISGHDLKDMEELLAQTEGTGVDVYTHSEMLPANYYPNSKNTAILWVIMAMHGGNRKKKLRHLMARFYLPPTVLVPPSDSYKDRVYTTGASGFKGVKHIADRVGGQQKDFSCHN